MPGSLVPLHGLYKQEPSLRPQTEDFSAGHVAFLTGNYK